MRMKIQFQALSAFTFLVEVVFGFTGFNNAHTQQPSFQDRSLPFFEGVPRHTRCIIGPYSTSDKSFGDLNALPYFTRCRIQPYGAGSTPGLSLLKNKPYAANAPYEAELSQSPDSARRSTLTFFTEKPTPPHFKGKPGQGQTAQTTFSFREADMNQPGPHLLFNQFHPFQSTKEYWLPIDESEYFPISRSQYFLNKNMASEQAIKSDQTSPNKIPNYSSGQSLHKQHEKTRQTVPRGYVEELISSVENRLPLSLPWPSLPQYPSLLYFSEEDEEEEDDEEEEEEEEEGEEEEAEEEEEEEEEEDPYYPQSPSLLFFPQERAPSSLHQYTSPSFFPEEQRFHQYTSPPFFPEERRTSSFSRYHYSQYASPETPSVFESDKLPFAKSLPFQREPFPGGLGLTKGRPSWYDEANGVKLGSGAEGFWPPPIRRRHHPVLSKNSKSIVESIFQPPGGIPPRND